MLSATPIYAGLLALLLLALSLDVIQTRRQERVSVGDGANKRLIKKMRVQANCAEYAPMGLILLALAEFQGAPLWVVHGLGLMLLVGRLCHAIGFSSTPQIIPLRQSGVGLTVLMIFLAALANVGHALL